VRKLASALVEKLRGEQAEAMELRGDIEAEVERAQARLRNARVEVSAAKAAIINPSAAVAALRADDLRCWARLRGNRKAWKVITDDLAGNASTQIYSWSQEMVPLDPDVIGYATDEAPAAQWSAAMARLLDDPEAKLSDG